MEKSVFVLLVSKTNVKKDIVNYHFEDINDAYMVACNYILGLFNDFIKKISVFETSKIGSRYEKDIKYIKNIVNLIKDHNYKDAYNKFYNTDYKIQYSDILYLNIIEINNNSIKDNEIAISNYKEILPDRISDVNFNIDDIENTVKISVESFLSEWIEFDERKKPIPQKIYNKILAEARKYGDEFFNTLISFSRESDKVNYNIFSTTCTEAGILNTEKFKKVFIIPKNSIK